MKTSFTFIALCIFFIACYFGTTNAAVSVTIDTFSVSTAPLLVLSDGVTTISASDAQVDSDVIGGEREIYIELDSDIYGVILTARVGNGEFVIGYQQFSAGIVSVIWDGQPAGDVVGEPNYGLANIDLTTDFTFAFILGVTTDNDVPYTMSIFTGTGGDTSSLQQTILDIGNEEIVQNITFNFADFTGTADFTSVSAIQMDVEAGLPGFENAAIDTSVFVVAAFDYEVCGHVFIDCNNNGFEDTDEGDAFNVPISATALNTANYNPTIFTDSQGNFCFEGVPEDTITVCVDNEFPTTIPVGNCFDPVTLSEGLDVTGLLAGITVDTSISIEPPTITLDCGDCTTPSCFAPATSTGCVTADITSTDSITQNACGEVITRTFSADGAADVTQVITVEDSSSPIFTSLASDSSSDCADGLTAFNTWLADNGGADVTDCSAVTWMNDATAITPCIPLAVTFTATDVCGNPSISTTATFSLNDNTAPTFQTAAQPITSQCSVTGTTNQNAYTAWLANNGNSVIVDDCGSFTVSNNGPATFVSSCDASVTVTFTAVDDCGNVNFSSATFSTPDTVMPTLSGGTSPTDGCDENSSSEYNSWLAADANIVVTDACTTNPQSILTHNTPGAPFPTGTDCTNSATVTFTAVDACGNSATQTQTYTITDTSAPTVQTQAQPLSVDCQDTDSQNQIDAWLSSNGNAVFFDACDPALEFSNNYNAITDSCSGASVTFTACDNCGQCASSTTTVAISDDTPPSIINAMDMSVSCETDSTSIQNSYDNWRESVGGASISDDCSPTNTLTIATDNNTPDDFPLNSLDCNPSITTTWTVTDNCGNSAQATATFTVNDSTAPTFTTLPQSQNEECDSSLNQSQYNTFTSTFAGAVAGDCGFTGITIVGGTPALQTITTGCSASTPVTFQACNSCDLCNTQTATFTITDTTPPTFDVQPSDLNLECSQDFDQSIDNWLAVNGNSRASDTCTTATIDNNFNGIVNTCDGNSIVTFIATDTCGNQDTASANVDVSDNTAPQIQTPAQDETVSCQDFVAGQTVNAWLANNGGAVAVDACTDFSWTNDFNDIEAQCDFETVTFTAMDACGNSASTTATFTVLDPVDPVWTTLPSNLEVECDGSGNVNSYNAWVNSNGNGVATDDCAIQLSFTNTAADNGPTTCTSTTVSFTVSEPCGGSATASATFSVVDTQDPFITNDVSDTVFVCDVTTNSQDISDWADGQNIIFGDICDSDPRLTASTPTTDSSDPCNTVTTATYTISDVCGNSITTDAQATIIDNQAPMLSAGPDDFTIECTDQDTLDSQIQSQWLNSNAGILASDACSNGVAITNDYQDAPTPCTTGTVVFNVADNCGNSQNYPATVSVTDTGLPTVMPPQDITLPCSSGTGTSITGEATATDQCWGSLPSDRIFFTDVGPVEGAPVDDGCSPDLIITRTFTATDPCGNMNTATQTITIEISLASDTCDDSDCECDECCPISEAAECLPQECLPQDCDSAQCIQTDCECPSVSRSVPSHGAVSKKADNFPVPQCEPVYIFVDDDDDVPNQQNSLINNFQYGSFRLPTF